MACKRKVGSAWLAVALSLCLTLSYVVPIAAMELSAPTLSKPQNGETNVSTTPKFEWQQVSGATGYDLQVSQSSGFSTLVLSKTNLSNKDYQVTSDEALSNGTYYWRVRAISAGGYSDWSSVWSFTVGAIGPTVTHENATSAMENSSAIQSSTENYAQKVTFTYYDDDDDEWRVEIIDAASIGLSGLNKTVVTVDARTGEIKGIQIFTASAISEEDAVSVAKEDMEEFLESRLGSEVWATYHGALGKWVVTAYDIETFEKVTAIVDGRTGKIQISAPTISRDNALEVASLQPAVDNFLRQYITGVDMEAEWEDGALENVEIFNDMLVLSKDSLGYTRVGSERDDTNLQSVICGSLFTAPFSGKIMEITAYAYYFGGADYKAGLYKKSDGSFVAETENKHIKVDRTRWETFKFSSPVEVTEGSDYFVVLWDYSERATRSVVGIYYDDDSQRGGYQEDTSGGAWSYPWSPTTVDRKYSIYATGGYRSGRYTGEWYDIEAPLVKFISKATIAASDNHKITMNVQVSDDGSTVKDNLLLNLDDGTNIYDISTLADAKYVRIDSFLSTDNPLTTPVFRSFSIIISSDLTSEYENVSNQWRVSFVDETGVSATVRIDATSGEVQETRRFSWKEAVEEFEEVMD